MEKQDCILFAALRQYVLHDAFCYHSGDIEGFVGLGDYTTSDHEGVPADHGRVVLLQPCTGKF